MKNFSLRSEKGLPATALLRRWQAGQSLMELIITIALVALILPALLTGFVATRSGRAQKEQRQQAIALVREGQESTRVFREADWTNFANFSGQTVYPQSAAGTWVLTDVPQALSGAFSGFTRTIIISDVYRDSATFAIVTQGTANSYNDPSTKKVTTTVGWDTPIQNSSVKTTEYLTRNGNIVFSESGTIQPPAGGNGNWCNPSAYIVGTPYNLGSIPIALTANTTLSQDFAYASTGNNSSGNPVYGLAISHTNPPEVTNPYSRIDSVKAYGIYSDGTYVYFNQANPGPTLRIAKASDLSDAGFFNLKNVSGPGSVYTVGTAGNAGAIGYTAIGNTLYSFDLSAIKGNSSQELFKSIGLAGNAKKIIVLGTNAYVVTDDSSKQLQIIPLLNGGREFGVRKDVDLGNGQSGTDLAIDSSGKYAYVVTNFSSGKNDLFAIDLLDTNNIYGYTTNISSGQGAGDMNPRGIAAVTDNKLIVVGCNADNGNDKCFVHSSGWIYQVFNFSSGPSGASRCGGMTPQLTDNSTNPPTFTNLSSINAIAGVDQRETTGNVFSYIIDGVNSSAQFQIVQGGTGTGGGSGNGIFESATLPVPDLGHNVAFNYFSATVDPNLSYKIAIKYGIDGSCSSVTFADSDFVSISPGPIVLPGVGYSNPGQCLRYQVINSSSAAIPYTININYSP